MLPRGASVLVGDIGTGNQAESLAGQSCQFRIFHLLDELGNVVGIAGNTRPGNHQAPALFLQGHLFQQIIGSVRFQHPQDDLQGSFRMTGTCSTTACKASIAAP